MPVGSPQGKCGHVLWGLDGELGMNLKEKVQSSQSRADTDL